MWLSTQQDSTLGPFLFLIHIIDLPNSCVSQYADNLFLFRLANNMLKILKQKLQQICSKLKTG